MPILVKMCFLVSFRGNTTTNICFIYMHPRGAFMGCLADVVYALFLLFVWKDRKDCLSLQSRIIRTIYVGQSIDYRKT